MNLNKVGLPILDHDGRSHRTRRKSDRWYDFSLFLEGQRSFAKIAGAQARDFRLLEERDKADKVAASNIRQHRTDNNQTIKGTN